MITHKIILNPAAGKGSAAQMAYEVERLMQKYGIAYDIDLTQRPWHAAEMTQKAVAEGFEVIIPAGGDGTANEVINGLMLAKKETGKTARMGVLPIGRGNDFAYSMGTPTELEESVRVLAESQPHKIDIGIVKGGLYPEGRYFGNGVGIGFDATVGFVAAEQKISGFAGYLVAAIKTLLFYYKAPLTELALDNQTFTQGCAMVSIMNGRRMGGGFMMAPQGDPSDGLLDLCIVADLPRRKLVPLIPKVMAGTQGTHPSVKMLHSRCVNIKAVKGSLPAHADGETLCTEGKELNIELLPQQIEFYSR